MSFLVATWLLLFSLVQYILDLQREILVAGLRQVPRLLFYETFSVLMFKV